MLKRVTGKQIVFYCICLLLLALVLEKPAGAQSLSAGFEDGRMHLTGSASFDCEPDYGDWASMATVTRFYSQFVEQVFSGGLSVSFDVYDEYVKCARPGVVFSYIASYSGGLSYDNGGPEPVCIMGGSPAVYASAVVPPWPEITVHEPVDIVSGGTNIKFSYEYFQYYNADRRIIVYLNNNQQIYDSQGLPEYGTIETSYDFSGKKGFMLLRFQEYCSNQSVSFEKLIYVEPEDSCADKVGKPVSVSSGTVYASETDFTVRGITPLTITRYYDSAETTPRDFGASWSHSYDTRVVQFPGGTNTYKVINPDGSNVYYVDNNNDKIYDAEFPKGEQSRLIKNTDGSFKRDFYDGSREEFNKGGYLTAVEDQNANRVTLTRDTSNKLTKITGPYGKEISVSYGTGNKISSVTVPDGSPGGRVYNYTYLSSGYLGKVTYPDGSGRNYEYVYISGIGYRLSGIKDEQGNYIEKHTYDTKGRAITSSADGTNERLTINYVDNTHTTVTDSLGHITAYTLDKTLGKSHAAEISGPGCRECRQGGIAKTYDDTLNVTSKTDARGNVTVMTYDANGNMLTKTEAAGSAGERTTSYTYDSFGQILTVTDHDGNTTEYAYDANGNLTEETDAQGHITTHTYGPYNEKLTTTDRNGNTTTYTYDQYGNVATITNELNQTTSYVHDIMGNPASMTDANGNTTVYEYDLRDWLIKETRPDGGEVLYEYDSAGNKTAVTDANGNRTIFTYDAVNRLIRTTDPEGNTINYTYDTENNMTSKITRDSSNNMLTSESYTYDAHNRLLRTTHPDNTYTEQSYDAIGNILTKRDENGNVTTNTYDALNRLTSVTDPAGSVTSYTYDSRDNLTSVTDANGNVTTYTYDSLNRLVSTISTDTGITTYSYDANGNMLTKTDANGVATTYSYDALNRQTAIRFPDAAQNIYYSYDDPQTQNSRGKLTSMTDPPGTTEYDYDKMGWVIMETRRINGLDYLTGYMYDLNGNVSMITYPGGRQIAYIYDQLNKVVSVTDKYTGVTRTLANNITYLPFGDITSMTYGNGMTVTKGHDNRNNLASLLTQDPQLQTLSSLSYTRDSAGNITAITDVLNPAKNKTYTYAAPGRLTIANGPWGAITYAYDETGNRTYETTNIGSTTYTYLANKLIASSGEKTLNFNYDDNGNTTGENSMQYIYNQNQRLTRVTDTDTVLGEYIYNGNGLRAEKTVNGQTTIFHYNQQGMLIAESTDTGTVTNEYVYLNGSPLAKINSLVSGSGTNSPDPAYPLYKASMALKVDTSSLGTGLLKYYYTKLRLNLVSTSITGVSIRGNTVMVTGAGTTNKITGRVSETISGCTFTATIADGSQDAMGLEIHKPDGTLYYSAGPQIVISGNFSISDNIYYYHNDHLGTPVMMTDSSGKTVWQAEFKPFGEPLSVSGSITNNLRFPGQYFDAETGLHQNWFRDYRAEIGRYMSFDPLLSVTNRTAISTCRQSSTHLPIKEPIKLNPFVYADNNPINFIDPKGLKCGSGWTDHIVPDSYGNFNFTNPCQAHDDCYDTCGASKPACDILFFYNMMQECRKLTWNPVSQFSCIETASAYYTAVVTFGYPAYKNAQKKACCK
jgi:RHS repeat-associated protein